MEGRAVVSRGQLTCPWLKYPVSNAGAMVTLHDQHLQVDHLEGRVGRRGHIKVCGGLPLKARAGSRVEGEGLRVDLQALELRVRNAYAGTGGCVARGGCGYVHVQITCVYQQQCYLPPGMFDASLRVRDALLQPLLGGTVRFSRGTMYFGAAAPPAGKAPSTPTRGSMGKVKKRGCAFCHAC